MKLKWYGHASFLVTADDGTVIVTDPYPAEAGYKPVVEQAHIIIMSSDTDSYHCQAALVPGKPVVINAIDIAQNGGERAERGIGFQAIETMEALDHREHNPEQNAMYRFNVDGVHIGHMGDVGNPLSERQLAFFEGVDVLLALTGGHPTIDLDDLKTVIDEVKPRLVVPMHFRTLTVGQRLRGMLWIQSFLDYFKADDVDFSCDSEVTITREKLPEHSRVLVMRYV